MECFPVFGLQYSMYFFLGLLCCSFVCLKATTPMTTQPPTTLPPLNSFYTKFSASLHRRGKKLDVKPIVVIPDVSVIQCLGLCLQRQQGSKSRVCRSFNFADRTCYMLNTYVCDGDRELKDAPGFSYYDLSDDFSKEVDFIRSKQCEYKGKCSNRCLKFKLFKTPLSWDEAHNACQAEEAFLAMPKRPEDHDTLIALIKKKNILQAWIGVRKRSGVFYYDNGQRLANYTVWGPDQPNDSGGTQQCVQMMNEMDYMWNDFDCARPVGFICQYVWDSRM